MWMETALHIMILTRWASIFNLLEPKGSATMSCFSCLLRASTRFANSRICLQRKPSDPQDTCRLGPAHRRHRWCHLRNWQCHREEVCQICRCRRTTRERLTLQEEGCRRRTCSRTTGEHLTLREEVCWRCRCTRTTGEHLTVQEEAGRQRCRCSRAPLRQRSLRGALSMRPRRLSPPVPVLEVLSGMQAWACPRVPVPEVHFGMRARRFAAMRRLICEMRRWRPSEMLSYSSSRCR
mmetsp:Transcript_69370/g.123583  ORF Transcript_69370/g.123583 Transcript_69370/m.123583 type:complete len:236 (+) Transcript_69370:212-919(+)